MDWKFDERPWKGEGGPIQLFWITVLRLWPKLIRVLRKRKTRNVFSYARNKELCRMHEIMDQKCLFSTLTKIGYRYIWYVYRVNIWIAYTTRWNCTSSVHLRKKWVRNVAIFLSHFYTDKRISWNLPLIAVYKTCNSNGWV